MKRFTLLIALAAVLAACGAAPSSPGSDDPVDETDPPTASQPPAAVDGILTIVEGQAAGGPGISISEAVAQAGGDQPLLVNGALFVDEAGDVLLCEAIAESFPPQCGGTRLEVRGLDLDSMPDLEEANGVRWAESVQLLGTVQAA